MKNVNVDTEALAAQEEADEQAAEEMFESKKGSKRLASIIEKGTAPDTFEAPEEIADEADENDENDEKAEIADDNDSSDGADSDEGEEQEEESADEGDDADSTDDEKADLPDEITSQLKEAFPDKDFDDAETVQGTIGELVADAKALKAEREANAKVYDLFESSDEMVQIAREMDEGKGFLEALALTVDFNDTLSELEENDPEQYKKVLKAQAKREAEQEKQQEELKKMEQQFKDNETASQKNITAFQKEKGMDDTVKDEFLGKINDHFGNIVRGKITPEFLEMMHKALNYEADVEKAKEKGKVKGRNEKINAEKRKKAGDGLPRVKKGKATKARKEASSGKKALAAMVRNSSSTFE